MKLFNRPFSPMMLLLKLLLLYAAFCLLMFFVQRSFLYHPDRALNAPETYGLSHFSAVALTAEDGTRLAAWRHDGREGWPVMVHFHGNGGHLGYRRHLYGALAEAGFSVLALEYRGYGTSEGKPTESGLYMDGRAALDYAKAEMNAAPARVMLYGESLGTAVAVKMATEYPVGAVVLEAPPTSIMNRAAEIFFYLPVRWMLHDRFDSIGQIAAVHSPLLILHGERDMTVPIAHGKALLAAANEPKRAVYFPTTSHSDFEPESVVQEVVVHAREHGLIPD